MSELPERFWAKTSIEDRGYATPCVVWTAGANGRGYGRFRVGGGKRVAHRVAYEALMGPVPRGFVLDHLCRVRACVAVDHLEPVTHQENVLRGESFAATNAAVTHCLQGHAFDAENTHTRLRGGRDCRACHRERNRAYRARQATTTNDTVNEIAEAA